MKQRKLLFLAGVILSSISSTHAQTIPVEQKLKGFDVAVSKVLKDWNVPGCGVGVVVKNRLVFAKGYGYRDLQNKLPVTPNTLFQIASNTKLFTATAVGFLVEEGKLDWDKPVKNYVPAIRFYNDELNANVTIRDMLSHRTGISRHDGIWYKSDFTRKELFDRLKYLEPSIPLRTGYLYNNLMYAASGYIVEQLSGQVWEDFVRSRIFQPLEMTHSIFVTEEMQRQQDFMTPYYEKRDTSLLLPYPFYTKQQGLGPAGSVISSVNDLSNWLIAQMNGGKFKNRQVISPGIIRETLQPASLTASVPDKYYEILNSMYGMGRSTLSYKGHYLTRHGGAIGGIYSQVSFMPADSVGVIVFVNATHAYLLPNIISNMIYDQLLALGETPWSERNIKDYLKNKATAKKARNKPATDRVLNTKPSHPVSAYAGLYEDPAYGIMEIKAAGDALSVEFNHTSMPLQHYHYDRFVTPDDEINGLWSLTFTTDSQGSIDQVRVSLDEKEVVFTRKADAQLTDINFLKTLVGHYELNGTRFSIVLSNKALVINSAPPQHLEAYRGKSFRILEFPDQLVEFLFDASGNSTGIKFTSDGKEMILTKKK